MVQINLEQTLQMSVYMEPCFFALLYLIRTGAVVGWVVNTARSSLTDIAEV